MRRKSKICSYRPVNVKSSTDHWGVPSWGSPEEFAPCCTSKHILLLCELRLLSIFRTRLPMIF